MDHFEDNVYDEEAYVPLLHRVPSSRFSANKPDVMHEAAEAWGVTLPEDSKLAVKVLNLMRALLDGSKSITTLSSPLLSALGEALGVFPDGDEHLTPAMQRDLIAPLFYQEEEIRSLSESELRGARSELLREWAFRLGIEPSQDDPDLIEAIMAYSVATDQLGASTQHQSQLSATRSSLFSAEPLRKKARPDEEDHFFFSQANFVLPGNGSEFDTKLQRCEAQSLATGNVVAFFEGNSLEDPNLRVSLFVVLNSNRHVLWVGGDEIAPHPGLSPEFSAQIPASCSVFVFNNKGLRSAQPLLGEWSSFACPPSASRTVDNHPSGRLGPQYFLEERSGSLARIDREEEARPARIMMDPARFAQATGVTGKFDSDAALNCYQLAVPTADRNLLGARGPHLRCLAAGMFTFTLQDKKLQGTHIRAFHYLENSEFRSVFQIQKALRALGRVYDAIIHMDARTQFFRLVFAPLVDLLDEGEDRGLKDLPVAFVEKQVTELLVKMGSVLRHPEADRWSRDELRMNLMGALHVDLTEWLTRGTLFQVSAATRSQSNGFRKPLKEQIKAKTPHTQPRSRHGEDRRSEREFHSRAQRPCFMQLQFHLGVHTAGCGSRDRCLYEHDITKFTTNQLKESIELSTNANLRKRLLDAINKTGQ